VLAGFHIGAFGAKDAVAPSDYLANSGPRRSDRFCRSVRQWADLYDVSMDTVQIFVFREPTRIGVLPNGLTGSPPPKSSPTWTAGIECRQFFGNGRGD
jgi:hypothetical protein